jgi:hypothetical protein
MDEKGSYRFQLERVTKLVAEEAPGREVQFGESQTMIQFRIMDPVIGIPLTESSGEWVPRELADKSDDWLRMFIRKLANG